MKMSSLFSLLKKCQLSKHLLPRANKTHEMHYSGFEYKYDIWYEKSCFDKENLYRSDCEL